MNPTANTSGNPYGLSNAPIAGTPLVPTTPSPAAPSFRPDISPPGLKSTTPVPGTSTVSPITPTAVPTEPIQPPLPPAPTLPIQTLNVPTPGPAVDPAVATPAPVEPVSELSPEELTITQLETEPDTSPVGGANPSSSTTPVVPMAAPVAAPTPTAAPVSAAPAPDPAIAQQFFGSDSKKQRKAGTSMKLDLSKFKPSRKQLIIAAAVVVGLAILAAVYFFVVSPMLNKPKTTTQTNSTQQTQTQTPVSATVDQSVIDDATSALTQPATDEGTTASTDDSSYATDASNSAANVGNSVNETTF